MAFIGINGKAREVSDLYVGISGKARKIVRAYMGVDGIAHIWWEPETPTPGGGGDVDPTPGNYPVMVAQDAWIGDYVGSKNIFTSLTFYDSYVPEDYDDCWNVDENNDGSIKCYKVGTDLIISGNGSGGIFANPDSSYMFGSTLHSGYTSLAQTFSALNVIDGLDVLDTSKVTNMSYMFYDCSVYTLDLSTWNTRNVTDMSCLFYYCSVFNLKGLTSWNTSNVTSMSMMFAHMPSLRSIDLSSFDTHNVTHMGYMFMGARFSGVLDLTSFNTQNCTVMSGMFQNCYYLTAIHVSDGWTTNGVSTSYMFNNCGVSSVTYV